MPPNEQVPQGCGKVDRKLTRLKDYRIMSGIVGIINLDGAPVDRKILRGMMGFMAYRGPDAQVTWIEDHVGFGQAMLRTTAESQYEHQPFTLDDQVWITANARIDARDDLIQKLKSPRPRCGAAG